MNAKFQSLKDNKEEMKKCEESPLYFYNTYVQFEGKRPLTQEQYDLLVKEVELHRNGKPLRGRTGKLYPMKPDEAYLKEVK